MEIPGDTDWKWRRLLLSTLVFDLLPANRLWSCYHVYSACCHLWLTAFSAFRSSRPKYSKKSKNNHCDELGGSNWQRNNSCEIFFLVLLPRLFIKTLEA